MGDIADGRRGPQPTPTIGDSWHYPRIRDGVRQAWSYLSLTTVVRLGPQPLKRRRASRVAELERIGTVVQLVDVLSAAELVTSVGDRDVAAVALDAPQPGGVRRSRAAAGALGVAADMATTAQHDAVRSTRSSTATGSSRRRASHGWVTGSCRPRKRLHYHSPHSRTLVPGDGGREMNSSFRSYGKACPTDRPRTRRRIRIRRQEVNDCIERSRVKPGNLRHLYPGAPRTGTG